MAQQGIGRRFPEQFPFTLRNLVQLYIGRAQFVGAGSFRKEQADEAKEGEEMSPHSRPTTLTSYCERYCSKEALSIRSVCDARQSFITSCRTSSRAGALPESRDDIFTRCCPKPDGIGPCHAPSSIVLKLAANLSPNWREISEVWAWLNLAGSAMGCPRVSGNNRR